MRINQYTEHEIVAIIMYTSLFFIIIVIGLVVFFYFSRKKIIEKELEKRDLEIKHQKAQLRAILITQEAERQRIAQDLHDDISSKLNVISLNSHLLSKTNLTATEVVGITDNIIDLTGKALQSTRRIAHDLLPPVLEKFGLDAGLEELCAEFNSSQVVTVIYKSSINFNEMEKDKALHLFRIVQELLNNSVRHGKASLISILFEIIDGRKTGTYIDNGIGFDILDNKNQGGLGMKNIQSRVDFLNGTINIESSVNNGVNIVLHF